ncbi:MAG: hypothetical protein EHM17_01085 [Verrucomicrobiaceae bacterium]|nr:MAG: hypothetical protein EHM17_01085 [Verrucomicrobiaceae bacterium]
MNINPDEARLALWLEDELHGEELATFEAALAGRAELFAAREEVRRWRGMMAAALPPSVEPPYPDFFNSRIAKAIRELDAAPLPEPNAAGGFSWRAWFMPVAACAGMAITFWLGGLKSGRVPEIDVTGAPRAIPVEPILYTPENGVSAEWIASSKAAASVIVLSGVEAIPDATDFSETVYLKQQRAIDSTAGLNPEPFSNE